MSSSSSPSPIQSQIMMQAFGLTPDQQQKLMAAQQQEAMAQALLSQGTTPISTEGRSIGGVGYKISPFEGLAKLAEQLSGKYQQNNANSALANVLMPSQSSPSSGTTRDNISGQAQPSQGQPAAGGNMFYGADGNPTALGNMQLLSGNRAVAEMRPSSADPMVTATVRGVETQMPRSQYLALLSGGGQQQPPAPQVNPMSGAPMQPGQAPPQMAAQPPIQPVSGPQGLPPPPTPSQVGNATAAQAPPINMSALSPGAGSPALGKVVLTPQQQAALEVQKAGATKQAEAAGAGAAAQAEDIGKNLADAQKTFAVAAGSLPRAMQRFDQLRDASKDASYGAGVDEENPGSILGDRARNFARTDIGEAWEPKVATANQTIDQATKQGVLSELGPQLAGLRGNKFLEGIASGASGLNLSDPPDAKLNAINGLQDQYISNLKSLASQRRSYGDPTAPSDLQLAQTIAQSASPTSMISVLNPQGQRGKVAAQHLPDLIQAGGQIQ